MSERVLLDTSAVIDLGAWTSDDLSSAVPVIASVTVAELAFGLDTDDLVERRARTDRFYAVLRELPVLPFDLAAARVYGTLAATVRRGGRDPRPRRTDLQIAATAAANDLALLTRNPDDFAGLARFLQVVAV